MKTDIEIIEKLRDLRSQLDIANNEVLKLQQAISERDFETGQRLAKSPQEAAYLEGAIQALEWVL